MKKITIATLFPEMFETFTSESIIKRAIEKKVVEVRAVDIRLYSHDKHHHVDDTPYGGGAGMVLRCDVMKECLEDITKESSHVVMLTPQGKPYNQAKALELSKYDDLVLVCGHYEGFDERIRDMVDEQISIGDYVLTGGELPAMVLSDSIIRLLDGAITTESHELDSYSDGLLEYPHYTRPKVFEGKEVPFVLQNGDHEKIRVWRRKESLKRTLQIRPDLFEKVELSKEDQKLMKEIEKEVLVSSLKK